MLLAKESKIPNGSYKKFHLSFVDNGINGTFQHFGSSKNGNIMFINTR